MPILVWAVSVAVLYLVLFLLPQWRIHRRMVRFKRERLSHVERLLREQVAAFDAEPTKAVADLVEALRRRRDEIRDLPEWPFNWKNLTGVLGLAASSTLPVVLKTVVSSVTMFVTLLTGAKSP